MKNIEGFSGAPVPETTATEDAQAQLQADVRRVLTEPDTPERITELWQEAKSLFLQFPQPVPGRHRSVADYVRGAYVAYASNPQALRNKFTTSTKEIRLADGTTVQLKGIFQHLYKNLNLSGQATAREFLARAVEHPNEPFEQLVQRAEQNITRLKGHRQPEVYIAAVREAFGGNPQALRKELTTSTKEIRLADGTTVQLKGIFQHLYKNLNLHSPAVARELLALIIEYPDRTLAELKQKYNLGFEIQKSSPKKNTDPAFLVTQMAKQVMANNPHSSHTYTEIYRTLHLAYMRKHDIGPMVEQVMANNPHSSHKYKQADEALKWAYPLAQTDMSALREDAHQMVERLTGQPLQDEHGNLNPEGLKLFKQYMASYLGTDPDEAAVQPLTDI